jgi:hypothetical protein
MALPGCPAGAAARWRLLGAVLMLSMQASLAQAEDRHAGYYYPPPQTSEIYRARSATLPDSDRTRRIGFVVQLTKQMLSHPYPPDYAVFVKGDEAEKMLIVALRDDVLDTLYRARALLAMLTAVARATPLFAQLGGEESFTFFDLLKILGFTQLTISDGESFAHQVTIE